MTVFQQMSPLSRTSFEALLPLQVNPSSPAVTGLDPATGMVLPDKPVLSRLDHFPSDLYDLRDESHLVRFMKALLGDSGAGQLRKRNSVAQFQNTMQGSHFYDLDRFYGAIFGVSRLSSELLWFTDEDEDGNQSSVSVNPHTDTATAQEWDDLENRDASFRDRITALAAAINLGATFPGIRDAAQAITQVDCDIYEVWSLLDTYGVQGVGNLWDSIEDLIDPDDTSWDEIEGISPVPTRPTWRELEDTVTIGRTGTNSRAEVVVVPKKDYDKIAAEDGQEEADRQQAEDESSLVRVLSILKPAGVLLTVDSEGLALHRDAPIANLVADSNYWEVATRVIPRADLVTPEGLDAYPRSLRQQITKVLYNSKRTLPKPPWAVQDAAEWSYAPNVVSVKSYAFKTGEDDDLRHPGDGPITDHRSDQTLTYRDGTRETFSADRAVMDPARALAARYAAEGILISHPYSGARGEVVPSG